jgi:uracil-DNA glycosylase
MTTLPNIYKSWNMILDKEFKEDYYKNIKEKIVQDINAGETIYPPLDLVFNAFCKTDLDNLKVVIL